MTEEIDWVSSPPHYQSDSGVECIDIIRHLPLDLGVAVKYVFRLFDKWNPEEDLNKAEWFLYDFEEQVLDPQTGAPTIRHIQAAAEIIQHNPYHGGKLDKHIQWLKEEGSIQLNFFLALRDLLLVEKDDTDQYGTRVRILQSQLDLLKKDFREYKSAMDYEVDRINQWR